MVAPDSPPDRWMCPRCRNIVEIIVYATLSRRLVPGPDGEYTEVTCPMCRRPSPGIEWRVVEVTGTEGIV